MIKKNLYIILVSISIVQADSFYNTSNMQGTTGIINTPTAEVLDYRSVEFQYSNQVDFSQYSGKKSLYESDQYFVNFGFLPNLELIGRLSNIEKKDKRGYTKWRNSEVRDLSASLKYQFPFYHKYLPKVAIGINDLGGQASNYDSKYIVATKDYKFLRASAGYGFDSINLLDGVFGSLEVRATSWATLLGEYDSKDKQVGLRLNTPSSLSKYFDASLLVKKNLSDTSEDTSFGLNLKMPLGNDHNNLNSFLLTAEQKTFTTTPSSALEVLAQNLVDFGFENVDVGELDGALYVAYENNILEHNELDAFGAILGFMSRTSLSYDKFVLVMKRSDTKIKQLSGNLRAYKALLNSPDEVSISNFKDSLVLSRVRDNGVDLSFVGENRSRFKTRVQLSPSFITFIGTDVGVFDYEMLANIYGSINLYKGFDLGIGGQIPLANSDELDKDNGVFKDSYQGSKVNSILLHRSDVFGDFINVASVGMYGDYWAGMESLTYAHENHTLSLKLDYLEERDVPSWRDAQIRTNYLGIYSYYIPQIDTNFRLTGGEYYYGDHGYEVRMKKFFGDTAISFFYQNSDQNYIGINVALPLTPRKVADSYFQLKGKNDFNYGLRTTVQDDDGRNTIETSYLVRVGKEFDIERKFLNRNRLNTNYVKKHVLRLRDAGIRYGVE